MWGICALSRSGFCCVKRLFKRRRMGGGETIDTAALSLVLCGLIQGKCYFSGTAQFQPRFSNLASRYSVFLCIYVRMAATQQLPAPWFNSIFPPVLKGNAHLRRGIQVFVPQTSRFFFQKAPNSNASLQTSIMRDLCPL